MRWRLLLSPPLDGVTNMAVDHALMARARRVGEGVVRVYSWRGATLSLGRNQRAIGIYTAARAGDRGIPIVRRATGGRALLHHREITYSIAAPASDRESLTESYSAINAILVEALHRLGVEAEIAGRGQRLLPPASAPCFELPAPGELTLGGRKLVGSAQLREQGAMLQHGSILVHDDQPLVVALADAPVSMPSAAATLAEALGREPLPGEFAEGLFAVVRERWDADASPLVPAERFEADTRAAVERFRSDAWTWRR